VINTVSGVRAGLEGPPSAKNGGLDVLGSEEEKVLIKVGKKKDKSDPKREKVFEGLGKRELSVHALLVKKKKKKASAKGEKEERGKAGEDHSPSKKFFKGNSMVSPRKKTSSIKFLTRGWEKAEGGEDHSVPPLDL